MEHSNQLDLLSLFWQADIFVKLVMLILISASVWSWTIVFRKARLLMLYKRRSAVFLQRFWNKSTIVDEVFEQYSQPSTPYCPTSGIFRAGYKEYKRLLETPSLDSNDAINNIERAMVSTMNKDMEKMETSLIILSSISSAAPFVGLLGTVWGIMNSFGAIASSQQTNLAVVAPGIAEALFATALGLIAAIPANIAYNRFTSDISHSLARLENFRHDFIILLSRSIKPR